MPKDTVKIYRDSIRVLNEKIAVLQQHGLSPSKWGVFFEIMLLIFISGIIGGVVNYYYNLKVDDEENEIHSLKRSIYLGIGATFVVPVFLIITQSKIIDGISNGNNLSDYIVFVSFCVLASIMSSKFLSAVSDSVIKQLEDVKAKTKEVNAKTNASIKAIEQRGGSKISETTSSLVTKVAALENNTEEIEFLDDPRKGKFGGKPTNDDFSLTVTPYEEVSIKGWYNLIFKVKSLKKDTPLTGTVTFYLHPTFKPDKQTVDVINGEASISRIAWGAFTIGAEIHMNNTKLELDLAQDMRFSKEFRNR